MIKLKTSICALACLGASLSGQWAVGQSAEVAGQAQAVFAKRCVRCHSQSQARGGLDMTSLDAILVGSNSGGVVEPGKPEESLVYTLAAHEETPKMPPNAPRIPASELKAIAKWIESLPLKGNSPTTVEASAASMTANEVGSALAGADALVDGVVPIQPLTGPMAITALAHSATRVAVSGYRQVLLFDLQQSQWIGGLNFPEGDVFALRFSADGQRLVASGGIGAVSGAVVCWDMTSLKRVASMAIEDDIVLAMDLSPAGNLVAVGGPKRSIEVIDLMSGARQLTLTKHADWVTQLSFSPDGALLASADRFGSIYLWDIHAGVQFDTCANHAGAVTGLQWSSDSNQLWSTGKDGFVQGWGLQSGTAVGRWSVSDKGICDLEIAADHLFTLDHARQLCSFDLQGNLTRKTQLDHEPTSFVLLDSDGRSLVGDFKAQLHLVDLSSPQTVVQHALPMEVRSMPISRFAPRAVERQVRVVQSSQLPPSSSDRPSMLEQTREALSNSQTALQQTKRSLAELEEKIGRLQELVEKLDEANSARIFSSHETGTKNTKEK